jgi:hypothetical protein
MGGNSEKSFSLELFIDILLKIKRLLLFNTGFCAAKVQQNIEIAWG